MLPIGEVLLQAGRLLRRRPSLLVPVAVGAVAARLMLGQQGVGTPVPVTVAFWLLNLALTAGLLSMIRAAHLSEMGGWDAFLVGVGRYFAPILAGSMVQLALVFLTLLPVVTWLRATVGVPDVKAILAGNLEPAQIEAIAQWAAAICAWAAVWGIVFFFLALWKQAVVAQSLSWVRAWQASASFVKGHWLPITGLLALEGVALALAFALVALKVSVLPEVGAIAMLLVNAYFTVAFMVAFIGPPPKGENVDATA